MSIILFFICFLACSIGAISGIGGGIIIKPVVEFLSIMPITKLNFLSGVTVFSMAIVSIYKNRKTNINLKFAIILALGASFGGLLGKLGFNLIVLSFDKNLVAFIQTLFLLIMNICIYIYMMMIDRIKTKNIKSCFITCILGLVLGAISAFLGIGGGPLNLIFIYYFYSMSTKEATLCSLIIVFFSQATSLIYTLLKGVPSFEVNQLFLMCFGGILGALLGSKISKQLDDKKLQTFFKYVLII